MNQQLLIWLSGEFDESDVTALRQTVGELAKGRRWTVRPPEFVDETDTSSRTRPEDEPVRTVGVVLDVTETGSSTPGTSSEEASALIDALAVFSGERALEMEVQLGNTYVGEIRTGVPDRLIREGLLARW